MVANSAQFALRASTAATLLPHRVANGTTPSNPHLPRRQVFHDFFGAGADGVDLHFAIDVIDFGPAPISVLPFSPPAVFLPTAEVQAPASP